MDKEKEIILPLIIGTVSGIITAVIIWAFSINLFLTIVVCLFAGVGFFISKKIIFNLIYSWNNPKVNNPSIDRFVTGQPINSGNFFGREKILFSLFRQWNNYPNSPIQNAAIYGEKRIGKTSILKQIKAIAESSDSNMWREGQKIDYLQNKDGYQFIYVDLQNGQLGNKKRLLEYILAEMNFQEVDLSLSDEKPLADFSKIIVKHLKKPTIIMLDEIGAALEKYPEELDIHFWNGLRSLATTQFEPQRLGFLLAGHEHPKELAKKLPNGGSSPFFNIFGYAKHIKGFTEQEAKELIGSSPKAFSEQDISFILDKCQQDEFYHPYWLQIACYERLNTLLQNDNSEQWKQEVEERLNAIKS